MGATHLLRVGVPDLARSNIAALEVSSPTLAACNGRRIIWSLP